MSKVINLGRVRKQRAREDNRRQGTAQAAKFGRSKSEKALEAAVKAKRDADLDGAKRDD